MLWSNESRPVAARARRAQGHDAEADAMLDVVAKQAAGAGLRAPRTARADRRPAQPLRGPIQAVSMRSPRLRALVGGWWDHTNAEPPGSTTPGDIEQ